MKSILFLIVLIPVVALGADSTIHGLPLKASPADADVVPIDDGVNNWSTTIGALRVADPNAVTNNDTRNISLLASNYFASLGSTNVIIRGVTDATLTNRQLVIIGGTNSPVRIGGPETTNIEGGCYITAYRVGDFSILGGMDEIGYPNDLFTARHTSAGGLRLGNQGFLSMNTDSNLTVGSTFIPTERLRIDPNGNFGIWDEAVSGTLNPPRFKMDILSASSIAQKVHIGTNKTSGAGIFFDTDGDYCSIGMSATYTNGQFMAYAPYAGRFTMSKGNWYLNADTGLTPGSSYAPRTALIVSGTNGFMGVNTDFPTNMLTVAGGITASNIITYGPSNYFKSKLTVDDKLTVNSANVPQMQITEVGSAGIMFHANNFIGGSMSIGATYDGANFTSLSTNAAWLTFGSTGNWYWRSDVNQTPGATYTPTTRIFIQGSDGKVGINTTVPTAQLSVNGTLGAVSVNATNGFSVGASAGIDKTVTLYTHNEAGSGTITNVITITKGIITGWTP